MVKGSAQYRMVVMPYRPMRRIFNYVVGTLLLLLVAGFCFFYGYDQGARAAPQIGTDSQTVVALEAEAERLRQEVTNLKLAAAVDAQAYEDVRRETVEQKVRITELEQDISVYRSMVSKSDVANPQGISMGTFRVTGSGGVRGFKYKFVVRQLVATNKPFKGTLSLKITGSRAQQQLSLPLHQVSQQLSDELIPLEFKYFQSVEGDLLLPEGFEPERVDVEVKSVDSKQPTHIERQLDWFVAS